MRREENERGRVKSARAREREKADAGETRQRRNEPRGVFTAAVVKAVRPASAFVVVGFDTYRVFGN